jgi:hypothetical protein
VADQSVTSFGGIFKVRNEHFEHFHGRYSNHPFTFTMLSIECANRSIFQSKIALKKLCIHRLILMAVAVLTTFQVSNTGRPTDPVFGAAHWRENCSSIGCTHSAVRLCSMLLDPMVVFQMFYDLCLVFKHLAYFWPSAVFIDETENHRPSVGKVPVLLVRMRIRLHEKYEKYVWLTRISASFASP